MRRLAFALVLLLAHAALAGDTWTTPYPGVRKLFRTTSSPAQEIHALVSPGHEVLLDPWVRIYSPSNANV